MIQIAILESLDDIIGHLFGIDGRTACRIVNVNVNRIGQLLIIIYFYAVLVLCCPIEISNRNRLLSVIFRTFVFYLNHPIGGRL